MNIIDENTNVCEINKFINKVYGINSDSSSPTDIWLVKFNKDVKYKNTKIKNGFLKIFLEYTSLPSDYDYKNTLKGLNYELDVYKDVIRPLIDYNICPNFVKYLASGKKCTYENLLNILKNNLSNFDIDKIKLLLNRNLNCIYDLCSSRLSIDNDTDIIDDDKIRPSDSFRYNMILNEQIPKGSIKFTNFLRNNNNQKMPFFLPIIFQIFTACYAMSLSKMVHNDLHSGNIFIEQLDKEDVFEYCINNNRYKIKTKYKVFLYDFDRSYVERFGDNEFLTYTVCNNNSQCNIYIENKDILKILCYINSRLDSNNNISMLLSTITDNKEKLGELLNEYRYSCFFEEIDSDNISFFKNFNSSETIVENIGKMLTLSKQKVKKENIYVLNKEFFNTNGSINVKKYEKIYNDTLNNTDSKSKEPKAKKPKEAKEQKPCNSDQIRNPATGRCVLKRSPLGKKILAEMGEGKDKDASKKKESNREPRKKEAKPKEQKPCNSDQIRNPATGRCVLKRSPLGKKILAEMGEGKDKDASKKKESNRESRKKEAKPKEQKPCNSDQIRNPVTGRCVLKRSPLGKKILAEMGEGSKSKKTDKIKVKKTLSNGNCFYSAIYRSLKDKNLLERLYDCINDLRSTTENTFIENFRNYLSNNKEIESQYKQLFDNIEYNLRVDKDYKKTINTILKDMGDGRKVIKRFLKNDKFKNQYRNEFINEIKENIRKNKTYVGEFEVISSSNILKNKCSINIERFTNSKNAKSKIENDSENKKNKTIYLIIHQDNEHWEYMD
jgi:hypothetical protein